MSIGKSFNKKNNAGFMYLQLILIIGIFVVLVLEIYRDYELHRTVQNTMQRLVNMSVSIAISEDTREDFAVINEAKAKEVFNTLLITELGLNADNSFGDDYRLNITSFIIVKQPPTIEVKGEIIASPFLLQQSIVKNVKVKLPFKAKSRTQHIGY
ncbi:hypothetical protein IMX26_13305 [Clostridium sp. 'deep sea']|uniref:hypothetical protein n=1 Tax=Clostridium sp. 'deep sea' TaxID=2779445 RepID=UPI001896760B|nr:hypothetical protein [Clostridium sp. 'deep sea']QOR34458.1 hypothetical protein IMX26_13305 [Clostridium sp. 'deep sea']